MEQSALLRGRNGNLICLGRRNQSRDSAEAAVRADSGEGLERAHFDRCCEMYEGQLFPQIASWFTQ